MFASCKYCINEEICEQDENYWMDNCERGQDIGFEPKSSGDNAVKALERYAAGKRIVKEGIWYEDEQSQERNNYQVYYTLKKGGIFGDEILVIEEWEVDKE